MFEHWGHTIYWDRMTWEAFAALVAILAAATVGWRQVGLQKSQAEIAALAVTEAVWERRLAVFDATHAYLSHIATRASVPGRQTLAANLASGPVAAPDIGADFAMALNRARFLFRPAVSETLEQIYRLAEDLADVRADANSFYEKEKGPLWQRASNLRNELLNYWADVPAIFGDELLLTAHRTPTSWHLLRKA